MKIILMHFVLKQSLQIMAASRDRVCEFCHGHHLQLSAPTQWRNEEARKYVTSMQVQSDALICKPCKDDVTRVLANPSLIPRWRKGSMTDKNRCYILLCGQRVFVHGRLASSEQMQATLKLAGLKCTNDTVPQSNRGSPTVKSREFYLHDDVIDVLHVLDFCCVEFGVS